MVPALAAVGTLMTLVEAASLAFLFTFTIVSALAFHRGVERRAICAFGALGGLAATVALVFRLIETDPLALVFLGALIIIAVFGRPLLLRHVRIERPRRADSGNGENHGNPGNGRY